MPQEPVIAKVIVDLPVREVDRVFDYLIPEELVPKIDLGSAVLVPFGRTKQVGYIVGFANSSDVERLLPVEAAINEKPVFDERMIQLCRWIAGYYLSTLSEALKLAISPGQGTRLFSLSA